MLATRANDGQAYIFVMDIHGNDIFEPTSIATTIPAVTKLASATILLSQSGDHLVVILSGGPNPLTRVTGYQTDNQRTISTMPVNNFVLSDGAQTGATMPLAGTDIDRIYLAGQVGNQATMAVTAVSDGQVNTSSTMFVTFES